MAKPEILAPIDDQQYADLVDSLPLITVLIAGADDKIDEQELNWAEKLTHIRTYADPEELNEFYEVVEGVLEEKLQYWINKLPDEVSERENAITRHLKKLNDIFPCLPNAVAYQLYESFTSFAEHIAKASGGFLRFGSISSHEKKWIGLPMIEPVLLEISEEE